MTTIEKRFAPVAIEPKGDKLGGVAAPYGVEIRIGTTRERIAPGAFAATIADGHDILALADHDPRKVLARTKAGTLRLNDTAEALTFDLDLPDTPTAAEVRGLAAAGNLGGVSVGFRVPRGGDRVVGGVRVIERAELVEISMISSFAAYPGTTADLRNATPRLDRAARLLRLM
ncbi:MAG: HK97 family phage prohead protease [Paracoccaceae bacterium]|nr:HK97 family phage prohead protease [Paracoccaceae bacterium]